VELLEDLDVVAAARPERSGGPLPDSVHGQKRGLLERRGEERAGRVGLVMLAVDYLSVVAQLLPELAVGIELLLDPERTGHEERAEAPRGGGEVGLQNPLELEQRLVVEPHELQLAWLDARRAQTILHRARGERRVALLAGEPLLLRRGEDLPVAEQAGGAVVIEGGDA
jgi:hypothetical protein